MYNLKIRRQEAGMSQKDLANASGVDWRIIQHYECEAPSGHRDINKAAAIVVLKLARALDCEMTDIMELNEEV